MNRQFIINAHKELLLATKTTLPTAFFVERRGVSLQNMDTLSRRESGDTPAPVCFLLGRRTAQERHWKVEDLIEVAYVTVEKQSGKEYLVFAFGILQPEPVFVEHLAEIRRSPGGVLRSLMTAKSVHVSMQHSPLSLLALRAVGYQGCKQR
jgi:hypothetical protein